MLQIILLILSIYTFFVYLLDELKKTFKKINNLIKSTMEKEISTQSFLRFYFSMIKPYKWWYILILMGPIGSSIHPLIYSYSMKLLVEAISQNRITSFNFLNPIFFFLYAEIYIQTSWRINNFAAWKCIPNLYQRVADKVFGYVLGHSYKFFQENLSGSLISQIRSINEGFFRIHSAIESDSISILKVFIIGISICLTNKNIALIVIFFVCIKVPLFVKFNRKIVKIEEDCQNDWHNIFGMISDNITNIFNLFAFATKKREKKKIWKYYEDVHKPKRFYWHKLDFQWSLILCLVDVSLLSVVCIYIITLTKNGKMNLGQVTFFLTSLNTFLSNLWKAFNDFKDFIQKYAQAKSAFRIMQIPNNYLEKKDEKNLKIVNGEIEFKNVTFSYEENLVFKDLSFKINKGEKVGIVGYSGVGKSTIISLLMKNFIPQVGQILIDDQDIATINSDSIMKNITYIPQEVILFHRSIEENIAYARDFYTKEDLDHAAESASLGEFIGTLPEGYATLVGERGVKLSGGQRQRISIARSFLKNSPILILDEATSALDSLTEKEIQNAMWELMKGKTCVVIAHRLSTLTDMDRILVIENGKIVQDGNHKNLILQEGPYKILWETQSEIV